MGRPPSREKHPKNTAKKALFSAIRSPERHQTTGTLRSPYPSLLSKVWGTPLAAPTYYRSHGVVPRAYGRGAFAGVSPVVCAPQSFGDSSLPLCDSQAWAGDVPHHLWSAALARLCGVSRSPI